jgi:sorbitol-specific phosphotransferase system component IIBC
VVLVTSDPSHRVSINLAAMTERAATMSKPSASYAMRVIGGFQTLRFGTLPGVGAPGGELSPSKLRSSLNFFQTLYPTKLVGQVEIFNVGLMADSERCLSNAMRCLGVNVDIQ